MFCSKGFVVQMLLPLFPDWICSAVGRDTGSCSSSCFLDILLISFSILSNRWLLTRNAPLLLKLDFTMHGIMESLLEFGPQSAMPNPFYRLIPLACLKVLSSDTDLPKLCSFDRSLLKEEARRFLEKSARPPSCESPLKIPRHLIQ